MSFTLLLLLYMLLYYINIVTIIITFLDIKMGGKALLNSHPKKESGSKGARRCRVCANQCAIIRKYHLNMCRQCFRERALDIGFIKVS